MDLPKLQYRILCESAKLVAEGGILCYSTCTLNPAENGEVAESFLKEHEEFEPFPIRLPAGFDRILEEPENQLTLSPWKNETDGFFFSLFRKSVRK